MSYYAQFDDEIETGGDVATILGWGTFLEWVANLEDADELHHLAAYGWSQELDDLDGDLDSGIASGGNSDAISVAVNLRTMIERAEGAEVLIVTSGEGAASNGAPVTDEDKNFGAFATSKATSASDIIQQIAEDFGSAILDFVTEFPQWFLEKAYARLAATFAKPYWTKINDTTRDEIESKIAEGIEKGQSIKEVASNIEEVADGMADYRAEMIARTETGNALASGSELSIRQTGEETGFAMTKVWLSVCGSTSREWHCEADGQEVGVDETFEIGGEQARWPGDENLSVGNRANCQCGLTSGLANEELDQSEEGSDLEADIQEG